MSRDTLRVFFWLSLFLVVALVTYKIYLNFFEQNFVAEHAFQVEKIEAVIEGRESYRFAVVGNISNSVGIFERKIIPQLNSRGYDFVISAGNAVSSGGEDKYRAIYRTLSRLKMPYVLTFGPQEESRIGGFRYYDHFGPLHFSFATDNTRFIFLDSTGTTDFSWQYRWLEEELAAADEGNLFLFSAHPFYPVEGPLIFEPEEDYLFEQAEQSRFTSLIQSANVDAVFSANLPRYALQIHDNTRYVVTGGAGGLVISSEDNHYHYVSVNVQGEEVTIEEHRLAIGQSPVWRTLESLWFFIHSLFYVGYLNFLLLLGVLVVIAIWLRNQIFTERDYYPDFENVSDTDPNKPLRIAMFTNNYLPYIGGVPISIERLRQGLVRMGHKVLIIAPSYPGAVRDHQYVLRVRALLPLRRNSEFRVGNIFSARALRRIFRFHPDVIHVHHPFWIGRLGLMVGRWLNIPVIYTYHTRLEHYAHYVPLPGPLFRNLVSHNIVRRFANKCDGIIVPTESAQEYLRTIGVRRRILVQPTGINLASFQDIVEETLRELRAKHAPEGEKLLITISRLSQEKNIDFLLQSVQDLKQHTDQPFRLLIIGEGPERRRLEKKISDRGLADFIFLVGAIPPEDIPAYCRIGDIFLFASCSETQGMVIIEAMAAGMPVVAVRSSGIDDIVENGFNGFKTPPDSKQWCEHIDSLLQDQQLYNTLSSNAEISAAQYSIDKFSDNVHQFYSSVLANGRKHHH